MRARNPAAIAALRVLLAALSMSGARAAGCAPADASLAGHYWLRGVKEVGSELELRADGRFTYMLAYGALDELEVASEANRMTALNMRPKADCGGSTTGERSTLSRAGVATPSASRSSAAPQDALHAHVADLEALRLHLGRNGPQ
jgi:hypothetical protein